MVTLSVAYMVRDEMAYMPESLAQSEKIADEIVCVVDSRSVDGTFRFLQGKAERDSRYKVFLRVFDFEGNQKNFARDRCTQDWIQFLDGDEILSDNCEMLKEVIRLAVEQGRESISIRGHHFMGSLGFEDAAVEKHWWQNRAFKNLPRIRFGGTHHAILEGFDNKGVLPATEQVRIFHFGYARNLIRVMEKNEQDRSTLEIHSAEFLDMWKNAHLFGFYPVKKYEGPLPQVILDKFKIPYKEGTVGADLATGKDSTAIHVTGGDENENIL